jgi:ribosomal protein S18 acetylase RimI-like enzyme
VEFNSVEDNLRQSFRALAANRPSGDIREIGGVSIASAGAAFQMFNAAFLSRPVMDTADLERRVIAARLYFEARGLPWSLWVCDGFLPTQLRRRQQRIVERQGMRMAVQLPGMWADHIDPPVRTLPRLEIRRVEDEGTRLAFCDIGCICFHVPLEWFRDIFLRPQLWDNGFVGWVGYLDGEPVATAATVVAAGAVGIYNVATMPYHRRCGHGEAVVRHALEEARRETGCERTILQSTEHGLNLYMAMGYKTVTTIHVYASD